LYNDKNIITMPVKYKAVAHAQPGVQGGGDYRYHARITDRDQIDLKTLCKAISSATTFSEADISGALKSLLEMIPVYLKQGYNVSLDDFGTFSLSLNSDTVASASELTSRNIRKVNLRFRPSKHFREALQNASFEKVSG
jgi:predicted histone-like DNA-binding protein